ncbi:MAG: thioredoxin family protein [Bacteroidales bacterium]|nr:thioredoxin family protein [Bacteroidales bacterium]
MKRFLIISAFLCLCTVSFAQTDSLSTRYAPLDSLLNEFYGTLKFETSETKCHEADYLIGMCQDSLTRQHVALNIFDHYRDSKVMGDESVSIYLYDNWFRNGKVKFDGDLAELDAEVFVKFNRFCQLDSTAVPVTLFKPCGGKAEIPVKGHTSVLFFYDTHCSKCLLETAVLPDVLNDVDFPLTFYAVYTGTDKASWKQYRRKKLRISNRNVRLVHLWDPELESSYQLYYGVFGTPRMYLVDPEGTIIGRRLEVENLKMLLPAAGAIQATYDRFYK